MGLGFLGSSAANPRWKYPLYNVKIEKEEVLVDCGAKEKTTGVVFLEFYWGLPQADVMFVFLEFYS